MNDIGDDVEITTTITVDGELVDPSTVTVAVTDPNGATTNPAVTNPSTGVFVALAPATIAGRWRYTWTTVDPDAVDHGYFDVSANPPDRPDPLATVADLEDRLGRDLTDTEARRATALLSDASALVRAFTRLDFDLTEGTSVVLRPIGGTLTLPQTPAVAVTSVHAIGGRSDLPDVEVSGWRWNGLDSIDLGGMGWRSAIDYDLEGYESFYGSYRVVYDHGYTATPDDVVGIVCGMVTRVLTAPTTVEGLTSERIGQYAYQYAQLPGGQSPGAAVRLTQADKDALADAGYKRRAGTIALRA